MNTPAFDRISRVLAYIHANLSSALSLEDIAKQSCWSRWQLQRVFQAETGLTVANYVRELKLSQAAEELLDSKERVIDIALELGFNSSHKKSLSFGRAWNMKLPYQTITRFNSLVLSTLHSLVLMGLIFTTGLG
ncbi:Helix-turn-helix protein [Vibrio crassostreae]|nr:helix-turn-helix protein [Vibrio crassostreae]CAK2423310.1 Helix-turn-helix protein [Vibrio crassostreae]CAK2953196.1 Helix-turn-helix protein [Vibrio crassostreae]CAK3439308.1 Helix-turn-helix protein [Vibrio crassostreae]CAK3809462.1 Helix-turn-helix protein [Vibrio crassostreae]